MVRPEAVERKAAKAPAASSVGFAVQLGAFAQAGDATALRDRVRAAILCAQFEFPQRRITVNLAPADLPKDGGRFDLAIALGILAASGQLPGERLEQLECLGELALSGALRPVQGVLPAALAARAAGRALLVVQIVLQE